jgi:hypothetical protein
MVNGGWVKTLKRFCHPTLITLKIITVLGEEEKNPKRKKLNLIP